MLDKLQKDAQDEEMEPSNTSPSTFLTLSVAQAIAVWSIAQTLTWQFQAAGACVMCGHWIGFIISLMIQSDKYFDITEDVTLFVTLVYIYRSIDTPNTRQNIAFGFAFLWCVRLCAFVGYRVLVRGSDWRFDKLITSVLYNLFGWTSGGTWCFFNCFCLWMLAGSDSTAHNNDLTSLDYVGIIVFSIGFLIEIVSDLQKYSFNSKHSSGANNCWIESGLWAFSRHPNYAGEITLWLGMSILCFSQVPNATSFIITAVTPIWSLFFLLFTSLMLLEKRADKKWGNLSAYKNYKRRVPVLFPGV